MIKKSYWILIALLIWSAAAVVWAQSSMTDQQVLDYARQGLSAGRSQQTLMRELVSKGVTKEQALRVKKLYEEQAATDAHLPEAVAESAYRAHELNKVSAQEIDVQGTAEIPVVTAASDEVYGRSIFRNSNLTFAPSANLPTPRNYVLGPGDEVIVDIFGANQNIIRSVINPEGYINIDVLGPVYLSGKSIDRANSYLKERLSAIYNGLNGEGEATDIQLSLGQIRSIQVSIIGEVPNPGTYTISSLSTVFHAMFQCGGVKEPGTIRNIKLVRNNKLIAAIDIYDFLINGNRKNDVRLEEGDVILVEPYEKVVKASGYVKRPMNFELKGKETLSDLFKFAGGFAKSAVQGTASVIRQVDKEYKVFSVEASQYDTFVLQDGDEVEIKRMESRFDNRISILGAVFIPGIYELSGQVNTVRHLVEKAGGLQPEAFRERAIINRQHSDRTLETVAIDLEGILSGTAPDVSLQNNDELYISSIYEILDQGTLTIGGEVAKPITIPYADNTTIKDLILKAGGLLRSASTAKVDVARLINDRESSVASGEIAQYYTFSITDGFAVDGADEFILEPYDVVTVRRSPSFVTGRTITASGEFNFPGEYNMSHRVQRVSDLVKQAGGLTEFAYLKGARIRRYISNDEKELLHSATNAALRNGDSILMDANDVYLIPVNLGEALAHPGEEADIVMRQGDVLEVPVYKNTVRICGAVQLPSTIAYHKKLSKRELIDAGGGYLKRANRRHAFIVYMNGRVARLKCSTKIEPGCQVYIPMKEKRQSSLNNVLGISTTAASLGMMGVSIANLVK